MQTRLQLLQSWTSQLQGLLPGIRLSRVRVLALLSLGLLWAGRVPLGRVAAALPLAVQDLSTERRLRRWLANRAVSVGATWQPLLRAFLAHLGQRELLLVFDPTPHTDRQTVLMLGLVIHKRVLPLAWHIVPGTAPWAHGTWAYLARLCRRVRAVLPPDAHVTLIVDQGLASAAVIDLCAALGWHYVLRLSVDEQQGVHVRLSDGTIMPAWELVAGNGHHWSGPVELFQRQGWRTAELTIAWPRRYDRPWLLLSDQPAGPERVRIYRRRIQVEAFYQDCKSRGWQLETSKLTDRNRLNRLLVALCLALWWGHLLGQQVIRRGERYHFDRRNRRDRSLLWLGQRWMAWRLDHDHLPPLPFRLTANQWRCRWQF